MEGCSKGSQGRLKRIGALFCQKGVENALDHMCDSLNSVVAGISEWLHDGWSYSYPASYRHHRRGDPSYSGTKIMKAIWTRTPAQEGEQFI